MEIEYLKGLMEKLAKLQVAHPVMVLFAVFVFTLLLYPGLSKVYFDNDNDNFLPENDPVVETLFLVDSEFGGNAGMHLLFFGNRDSRDESIDLRDPDFLRKSDLYAKNLGQVGYVVSAEGPAELIKNANGGVFPNDIETVKKIISQNKQIGVFYNEDFTIMRMTVNLASFPNDETGQTKALNELRQNVYSIGVPSGVEFKLWGQFIQFQELNKNQAENMGVTTILSFVLIFVLIMIFYRSVVLGVMSLIPIILALMWTISTMGYIDLPFTVLSTGLIPLVVGFGIDYSIHLTHSIRHLEQQGKKIEDAVSETMRYIGESLMGSSLTTAIGFLSLTLASLLVTQRLGLTLAISAIYVLIACIVVVPPIVLLNDRIFKVEVGKNKYKTDVEK